LKVLILGKTGQMRLSWGFTLTESPNLLSFADDANIAEAVAYKAAATDSLKGRKS
jgi:hypothetical protein